MCRVIGGEHIENVWNRSWNPHTIEFLIQIFKNKSYFAQNETNLIYFASAMKLLWLKRLKWYKSLWNTISVFIFEDHSINKVNFTNEFGNGMQCLFFRRKPIMMDSCISQEIVSITFTDRCDRNFFITRDLCKKWQIYIYPMWKHFLSRTCFPIHITHSSVKFQIVCTSQQTRIWWQTSVQCFCGNKFCNKPIPNNVEYTVIKRKGKYPWCNGYRFRKWTRRLEFKS